MKTQIQLMNATTPLRQLFNRSLWRHGFLVVPLVFAVVCPALAPRARATCEQGCDTTLNNTFLGNDALNANTIGTFNTATGGYALAANTTGSDNTASGFDALYKNTAGYDNTADGAFALEFNTTGVYNTASGAYALNTNTTGYSNTATGYQTLGDNTTGYSNTASGFNALISNTIGDNNTAQGSATLVRNTTGYSNTADGYQALADNTTGYNNIGLGAGAGQNLTTGSSNIDIGNVGVAAESNTIRIGTSGTQTATYIAGIRGVGVAGGQPVAVSANGQLGIRTSSARFKENIKPMDKASEAILSLKPVTFRYKNELDPKGAAQFGLVAEEVAKISPDLVARDDQGKPFTVRYEEVNAMLLNEFIKAHRKLEEQGATIAEQQKQIQALTASFKEQSTEIKKVNARLTGIHPDARLVTNE